MRLLQGIHVKKECRRTEETEQVVKIGDLYDMGWQRRGKSHNSLTGLSPIYDIQ